MANFKVHISVAAGAGGLLASFALAGELADPAQTLALAAGTTLGGILPDLDSDNSTPLKIIFTSLAGILAFLFMFAQAEVYSLLELWLLWTAVYLVVRYPLLRIFTEWTVHRGVFHSVVAALFFWFLTTTLGYYVLDADRGFAWLLGLFVALGFMVHLLLDELYSVDLMNKRLKRSFGTALKIINFNDMKSSMALIIATLLVYLMTPGADQFLQALGSARTYATIWNNFLPQGVWFAI